MIIGNFGKQMSAENIYYQSPIGLLEIRMEDDSITHILFVNTERRNKVDEKEIRILQPSSPVLNKCIHQLEEYFTGHLKLFDLPLKQEGTEFQKEVWGELSRIPYGRTINYHELSKRIGNARAIRAVGSANGQNHISIIGPCHRVIGSDGSLVGYGGDLWRKKWLLEHEGKFENGVQSLFS